MKDRAVSTEGVSIVQTYHTREYIPWCQNLSHFAIQRVFNTTLSRYNAR